MPGLLCVCSVRLLPTTCYSCVVAGCVAESRQDHDAPYRGADCRCCRRDRAAPPPAPWPPRLRADARPLPERCASFEGNHARSPNRLAPQRSARGRGGASQVRLAGRLSRRLYHATKWDLSSFLVGLGASSVASARLRTPGSPRKSMMGWLSVKAHEHVTTCCTKRCARLKVRFEDGTSA